MCFKVSGLLGRNTASLSTWVTEPERLKVKATSAFETSENSNWRIVTSQAKETVSYTLLKIPKLARYI
jgi:hypothetical protein